MQCSELCEQICLYLQDECIQDKFHWPPLEVALFLFSASFTALGHKTMFESCVTCGALESVHGLSGNHLTMAPPCGENLLYSYSFTLIYMSPNLYSSGKSFTCFVYVKSSIWNQSRTRTRLTVSLWSWITFTKCQHLSRSVKIIQPKMSHLHSFGEPIPLQLSAEIHPYTFRLDIWRDKASPHSKPQSINLQ